LLSAGGSAAENHPQTPSLFFANRETVRIQKNKPVGTDYLLQIRRSSIEVVEVAQMGWANQNKQKLVGSMATARVATTIHEVLPGKY
jgi:hypothetical protein